MPFLLAEILNFQGSTHRTGVGSFSYLFVMFVLTVVYYILFGLQPAVHVDQSMLFALTSKGFGHINAPALTIDKFYYIDDIRIPYSIVSACTFVLAYFSQIQYGEKEVEYKSKKEFNFWKKAVFIVGVLFYVIPAILCWFPPKFINRTIIGNDIVKVQPDTTTNWCDTHGYQESFLLPYDAEIQTIDFYAYSWDKIYSNDDVLFVSLLDKNGVVLEKQNIELNKLSDPLISIEVDKRLHGNEWYTLSINGSSDEEKNLVALGVYNQTDPKTMITYRTDNACNYNIAINVKGKPLN